MSSSGWLLSMRCSISRSCGLFFFESSERFLLYANVRLMPSYPCQRQCSDHCTQHSRTYSALLDVLALQVEAVVSACQAAHECEDHAACRAAAAYVHSGRSARHPFLQIAVPIYVENSVYHINARWLTWCTRIRSLVGTVESLEIATSDRSCGLRGSVRGGDFCQATLKILVSAKIPASAKINLWTTDFTSYPQANKYKKP